MLNQQVTPINFSIPGSRVSAHYAEVAKFADEIKAKGVMDAADAKTLQSLGYPIIQGKGVMDAAQVAMQTTATIGTPVQFLQTFLPGIVRVFQAPLLAETAIGFTQAGSWEDSAIVQRVQEWLGFAREYGDLQAKPNVSYNLNYAQQSVVRFEVGVKTSKLEEMRASRNMISDVAEKQAAAALILEQILNSVAFYGYNSGNNLTYGILNNPNLPSYVPVASTGTGSSPLWSTKTWKQRQDDIVTMASGLLTQTKTLIDPTRVPTTMLIPSSIWAYFSGTTDLGYSLKEFMDNTYPLCRIIPTPQMDGATGGLNAMYWFADSVPNSGTDDGAAFRQVIPAKFMNLGVQQQVDGFKTGYTCATAGVFALRPVAIYRASSM